MTDTVKLRIPIDDKTEKLVREIRMILANISPEIEVEVEYVRSSRVNLTYENEFTKQLICFNNPESMDYGLIARTIGLARYLAVRERKKVAVKELE